MKASFHLLLVLSIALASAGCTRYRDLRISDVTLRSVNEKTAKELATDGRYRIGCRVNVAPNDFKGKRGGFWVDYICAYELPRILDDVFNSAVYTQFQQPGNEVVETFEVHVDVHRCELKIGRSKAYCRLELMVTCREPGGKLMGNYDLEKKGEAPHVWGDKVPDIVYQLASDAAVEFIQSLEVKRPKITLIASRSNGRAREATNEEWDSFIFEIADLGGRKLAESLVQGYSKFTRDDWRREIQRRFTDATMSLISDELKETLTEGEKTHTVAVLNFKAPGGESTTEGRTWADRLTARLVQQGVKVVERDQIDQIIKEQQFSNTELVDENQRLKFGQLAGASVIISGTVGRELAVKAVDTERGKVLYAITLDRPF